MTTIYDAIVIGAGGMGSAAAYYLSRMGQKTLLLEQFQLDHDRGSSYGESRIIRYAYDHPAYIALAKASYPLWRELEAASGEELYIKTGGIDFGIADDPQMLAIDHSLTVSQIPFEKLSPAETAQRFPQFRLEDGMETIYQADAGVLKASQCVKAHVRLAQQQGTTLIEQAIVQRITPTADHVTIETSQGTFQAGRLVMAAGSWSKHLLEKIGLALPLAPTREQQLFFRGNPPENFLPDQFPTFIAWLPEITFYGISNVDGKGFKCAQHRSGEVVDPDQVKREIDPAYIERVRGFMKHHIPTGDGEPTAGRICLYTMTPDEDFIIDRHPEYPYISFGAGFSGHGFKFTTLIGQILANLACGAPVEYDLSHFRWDRFSSINPVAKL